MKKAFTLIELLIVVAIIAILAAIAVPNFLEAQVRSKVSRVKSDQRSFATALESYYIDNNTYPVWWGSGYAANTTLGVPALTGISENVHSIIQTDATKKANSKKTPTFAFATANNGVKGGLTTPVSFLTSYAKDVFAEEKENTFGYVVAANQWILTSPGPSATNNTTALFPNSGTSADLNALFLGTNNQTVTLPSPTLITRGQGNRAYTYDPTNGTSSAGDVWKTKG